MKRNVFYGALLVLLLGFLVRENRLIHIPKQVEKTEESAEWQPEWYEQMAEEINDSPITLEVDGTMVDPQLGSLRMSQDGQFMIPYGMLPDALSCAALLYDGNRLVMERGNTHAEMTVGSPELLLGEARSLSIVSVALGVGYGMGANTGVLAHAPQAVQLIFGGSGIVPAAMVAILLNILLPKETAAK